MYISQFYLKHHNITQFRNRNVFLMDEITQYNYFTVVKKTMEPIHMRFFAWLECFCKWSEVEMF